MHKYKISFCTVSMNRLDHLKMTFLKNLYDNLDYKNVEFVLLNYNSNDDMDDWVRDNLMDLIEKGIVKYYHTKEPNFFHRSHSRNMMFKLAEGDIICNVDADNFIGKGFANYVNLNFNIGKNIFIAPPKESQLKTIRNVQGRICLKREDFYKIKGFDERIMDYGYEDHDLTSRLLKIGKKKITLNEEEFLGSISHDIESRLSNEYTKSNLRDLLINYETPIVSNILFVFKDYSFEKISIIDSQSIEHANFLYPLKQKRLTDDFVIGHRLSCKGKLSQKDRSVYDNSLDSKLVCLELGEDKSINGRKDYYRISDNRTINRLIMFKSSEQNKEIMDENKKKCNNINEFGYGRGLVRKNFTNNIII